MPDKPKAIYGGREATSQADMDAIYEEVLARFEDERRQGPAVVHRETSVAAAPAIPDESLDWVYVDGDHTYDAVRNDLEAWAPKVKPGGLLTGDDYGSFGWWEGDVQRAVDEFVAARRPQVLLLTSHFALRL
jgi:Methyltransferase domain